MSPVKDSNGDAIGFTVSDIDTIGGAWAEPLHLDSIKARPNIPAPFRYPATTDELLEFAREFFATGVAIAHQRNLRYAGAYDPFKNFKLCGDYGIVVRMSDKVSRLVTLTSPGNTIDAGDESILDTCLDLANYAMLLAAYRANERGGDAR